MKTIGSLIIIAILMAGVYGYVRNIYKFCTLDFQPSYKAEVIRGLAVPTGLGFVVGYVNFEEEKK